MGGSKNDLYEEILDGGVECSLLETINMYKICPNYNNIYESNRFIF